jgi:hypothetical protein
MILNKSKFFINLILLLDLNNKRILFFYYYYILNQIILQHRFNLKKKMYKLQIFPF